MMLDTKTLQRITAALSLSILYTPLLVHLGTQSGNFCHSISGHLNQTTCPSGKKKEKSKIKCEQIFYNILDREERGLLENDQSDDMYGKLRKESL